MLGIDLTGQTALITGGNQGIGWSIAELFSQHGARVVVNYPEEARYPTRFAELPGEPLAIRADVGKVDEIRAMFAELDRQGVAVDILVNNAGIYPRANVLELDEATWDAVHNVNLKGTFFCAQEAARRMVARGGGKIINIASTSALQPAANGAHYGATKAGVVALTKSLALALAKQGVLVNAIGPGLTDTAQPRFGNTDAELIEFAETHIPLGRMAQPIDIAKGALFLASDLASFMTGQTIFITGGELMVP